MTRKNLAARTGLFGDKGRSPAHLPRCCAGLVRGPLVEALETVRFERLRIHRRVSREDFESETLRYGREQQEKEYTGKKCTVLIGILHRSFIFIPDAAAVDRLFAVRHWYEAVASTQGSVARETPE